MATVPKLWFKAKRFGLGWSPVSWQGWVSVGLYIGSLITLFILLLHDGPDDTQNVVRRVAFLMLAFSLSLIMIGVCLRYGEPIKWRWSHKPEGEEHERKTD